MANRCRATLCGLPPVLRLYRCICRRIRRCSAPCVGRISEEDYGELVEDAKQFLAGKSTGVQARLGNHGAAAFDVHALREAFGGELSVALGAPGATAYQLEVRGDGQRYKLNLRTDEAFEVFYAGRNQVEFYPDALAALARLSARWPVAALTNGNADLARIGIDGHFRCFISARDQGHAKPDTPIFLATCERLGLEPAQVLHIGDDPLLDVMGARRAGLRSCWINRKKDSWPLGLPRPDLEFATLAGLADWLESHPDATEPR